MSQILMELVLLFVVFSCMILGYFSLFGARQCHVIEQKSFTNARKYPKLLVFKIFFNRSMSSKQIFHVTLSILVGSKIRIFCNGEKIRNEQNIPMKLIKVGSKYSGILVSFARHFSQAIFRSNIM